MCFKQIINTYLLKNEKIEEKERVSYFKEINKEIESFKVFKFSQDTIEYMIYNDNIFKKIYNYLFEYIAS